MHWAALGGDSEDAYVLARLGLYALASEGREGDARAAFGRLLACTALGAVEPARLADAERLPRRDRRSLARAAAPLSPAHARIAARLLPPSDLLARTACLLAAGETGLSLPISEQGDIREMRALRAGIAARSADHRTARAEINAMFAADGLAPPLGIAETPATLDEFENAASRFETGPLVSVIVPVHNSAATIAHAVASLQRQSWRDLEILVVDDRSEDNGAAILAEMAAADERIRLLVNARTPGVYGARNTAIEAAAGEYVAFLDADDWSPSERIARQVQGIGDDALILANHVRLGADGAPFAPRVFPVVRPVPIAMLLRRETLLAAGPFEEVRTGADSEMLARLERRYGRSAVGRDPAVLLVARWRDGSLSEAGEGGMFGRERLSYRADWMFRHAGLEPPRLPAAADAS